MPEEPRTKLALTNKLFPFRDSVPVAMVTSCPEAFQSALERSVKLPPDLLMVMSPSGSFPPWSK
ncbi:MAG: hypothetical protein KCHDKBKB_02452 [Elusimicrobia bacterium]|nr:hypothetical protein [Elusimicrobiota bacterium]